MGCGKTMEAVNQKGQESGDTCPPISAPHGMSPCQYAMCLQLAEENGCDSWEEFIDSQTMGDCQQIAADVERLFGFRRVFGEIECDDAVWSREDGEYLQTATHHWNMDCTGNILDFSKGTLRGRISDYEGDYSVEVMDEARYSG